MLRAHVDLLCKFMMVTCSQCIPADCIASCPDFSLGITSLFFSLTYFFLVLLLLPRPLVVCFACWISCSLVLCMKHSKINCVIPLRGRCRYN